MAALQELALVYGIEPSYENTSRRRVDATDETLLRTLQALGAPVESPADVDDALQAKKFENASRIAEPVVVVWKGDPLKFTVRLPRPLHDSPITAHLVLEEGDETTLRLRGANSGNGAQAADRFGFLSVNLDGPILPCGYHRLMLEVDGQHAESLVIVAPRQAYLGDEACRHWGLFAPTYSLRSESSWGIGDFSDLKRFGQYTRAHGGNFVATLPLLAAFLDEPFEASPYSPASRLFWNECFLDLTAIPEMRDCPTARYWLESDAVRRELAELRSLPLVDYRRVMRLKRQGLKELARHFFQGGSARRDAFYAYAEKHPRSSDYAIFRAVGDRQKTSWYHWPEPLRNGQCRPDDVNVADRNYHLYAQWLCEEQIASMSKVAGTEHGLYLDLPLGVSSMSYDVWRKRQCFATEASGGCPPDLVYTSGQNWGFPPLHPQGIREDGYEYLIESVRHQMRYACALRIDHMPVFHRLYWIPHGMSAREGAYVRYASQEFYAIFSLESHRHRTLLIGEDLGTIAPEVRRNMQEHRVHRMFVVQYAVQPKRKALPEIPAHSAASINTHDMPPLASYIAGKDINERLALGLLDAEGAEQAHRQRQDLVAALKTFLQNDAQNGEPITLDHLLEQILMHLADSDARLMTINLEDLWLETASQNIPSTTIPENWRRKLRFTFDEWAAMPHIGKLLDEVSRRRATEKCTAAT